MHRTGNDASGPELRREGVETPTHHKWHNAARVGFEHRLIVSPSGVCAFVVLLFWDLICAIMEADDKHDGRAAPRTR